MLIPRQNLLSNAQLSSFKLPPGRRQNLGTALLRFVAGAQR
jgi:hypothetical protein